MTQALRVALWVPTGDPAEVGDNVVTINSPTAQKTIPTKFAPNTSGGGIAEAPEDGTPYARQNGGWVPLNPIDGGQF